MWILYEKSLKLCQKCKLSAICLIDGQQALLERLGMCRMCGNILLGGRIYIETHIRSTGQTQRSSILDRSHRMSVASLPSCVKKETLTNWDESAFVDSRDCPHCQAMALNQALAELMEGGTWKEWQEALKKSKLAKRAGGIFTA